jgi:c(7)-type cytochrome triheme protein
MRAYDFKFRQRAVTLLVTALLAAVVLVAFAGSAAAVPPDRELVFRGGEVGKIIFSGKAHADAGFQCDVCHSGIFEMKAGTSYIRFADHLEGKKYCFTCHNGSGAFKAQGNCYTCHKK